MKGFVLWALLLFSASVVALMFFGFYNIERASFFPGSALASSGDDVAAITSSRKLKQMTRPSKITKRGRGSINLEDYLPVDPAPSSKASVRPGPIDHGTPIMPFIPKSPPPVDPPKGGLLP